VAAGRAPEGKRQFYADGVSSSSDLATMCWLVLAGTARLSANPVSKVGHICRMM
jgi:hypothetical protein